MSIAVYVGAGLDVRPIRALTNVTKFIYIDSLPSTQQPEFDKKYKQYDKTFINNFCRKMEALDFDWDEISLSKTTKPFTIHFRGRNDVVIDYYMNTPFPSCLCGEVKKEIAEANTLIVAGFHPHECILGMMKKPVNVLCWEGTWYGNDEYDDCKDSVVRKLYRDMTGVASLTYFEKQYVPKRFESIKELEENRLN